MKTRALSVFLWKRPLRWRRRGGRKTEGFQSTLDEIAPTDPRAKTIKPQEMIDTRYLDEMEKSGFFEQLWGGKRQEWPTGKHGVLSNEC